MTPEQVEQCLRYTAWERFEWALIIGMPIILASVFWERWLRDAWLDWRAERRRRNRR